MKQDECQACIGVDGDHTCEGWEEFQRMKADRNKCQSCAGLVAVLERIADLDYRGNRERGSEIAHAELVKRGKR